MSNNGMFTIFRISQSGLNRQMKKLEVTAENIANADKAAGPNGEVYKRQTVVDKTIDANAPAQFGKQLNLQLKRSTGRHLPHKKQNRTNIVDQNKENLEIHEDETPKLVYNPGHPLADENGYVRVSNVNMVEEMANMMSASRAYDANLSAIDAAKNMAEKAMKI